MKLLRTLLTLMVVSGLIAVPLLAHHSVSAGFDETKVMTVQGVITKVEWTNPHVWLYLDVKNPNGSIANWGIEIAAPNALTTAHISRTSIEVGISYSIEVWPARNGTNKANGRKVIFADGNTIDVSDKFGGAFIRPPAK